MIIITVGDWHVRKREVRFDLLYNHSWIWETSGPPSLPIRLDHDAQIDFPAVFDAFSIRSDLPLWTSSYARQVLHGSAFVLGPSTRAYLRLLTNRPGTLEHALTSMRLALRSSKRPRHWESARNPSSMPYMVSKWVDQLAFYYGEQRLGTEEPIFYPSAGSRSENNIHCWWLAVCGRFRH